MSCFFFVLGYFLFIHPHTWSTNFIVATEGFSHIAIPIFLEAFISRGFLNILVYPSVARPDIMTSAKLIAGGMPLSAVTTSAELSDFGVVGDVRGIGSFVGIELVKTDCDVYCKQYHLIDEDFELEKGVEVINLTGHTPNLLGLVIYLENETIILSQDEVYTEEIYGPSAKISGLLYDSINCFKSIEKFKALQKKYNEKVIFAHDNEFFKILKLAPDFYI